MEESLSARLEEERKEAKASGQAVICVGCGVDGILLPAAGDEVVHLLLPELLGPGQEPKRIQDPPLGHARLDGP